MKLSIYLEGNSYAEVDIVPPGITLGTASHNAVILQDDSNSIALVQVAIRIMPKGVILKNIGDLEIEVNFLPVVKGQEITLHVGDQIQIAQYNCTCSESKNQSRSGPELQNPRRRERPQPIPNQNPGLRQRSPNNMSGMGNNFYPGSYNNQTPNSTGYPPNQGMYNQNPYQPNLYPQNNNQGMPYPNSPSPMQGMSRPQSGYPQPYGYGMPNRAPNPNPNFQNQVRPQVGFGEQPNPQFQPARTSTPMQNQNTGSRRRERAHGLGPTVLPMGAPPVKPGTELPQRGTGRRRDRNSSNRATAPTVLPMGATPGMPPPNPQFQGNYQATPMGTGLGSDMGVPMNPFMGASMNTPMSYGMGNMQPISSHAPMFEPAHSTTVAPVMASASVPQVQAQHIPQAIEQVQAKPVLPVQSQTTVIQESQAEAVASINMDAEAPAQTLPPAQTETTHHSDIQPVIPNSVAEQNIIPTDSTEQIATSGLVTNKSIDTSQVSTQIPVEASQEANSIASILDQKTEVPVDISHVPHGNDAISPQPNPSSLITNVPVEVSTPIQIAPSSDINQPESSPPIETAAFTPDSPLDASPLAIEQNSQTMGSDDPLGFDDLLTPEGQAEALPQEQINFQPGMEAQYIDPNLSMAQGQQPVMEAQYVDPNLALAHGQQPQNMIVNTGQPIPEPAKIDPKELMRDFDSASRNLDSLSLDDLSLDDLFDDGDSSDDPFSMFKTPSKPAQKANPYSQNPNYPPQGGYYPEHQGQMQNPNYGGYPQGNAPQPNMGTHQMDSQFFNDLFKEEENPEQYNYDDNQHPFAYHTQGDNKSHEPMDGIVASSVIEMELDPLREVQSDGTEQYAHHIFSNDTPSTLNESQNPAKPTISEEEELFALLDSLKED